METSKLTLGRIWPTERRELRARVRSEFLEMPGLVLTHAQAVRFFGLDPNCCNEVLSDLVGTGFLATDGRRFMRSN